MRERGEFAGALLLQLIGAAGALLIAGRTWQTVITPRPRPFRDDVLHLSGRTIDAAPTALALVALAGVVAVIATRGWPRRAVGALVALAGAALAWRSLGALQAVSQSRAHALVVSRHSGIELGSASRLLVHAGWSWLSAACGVLVLFAGALVAWRGARWRGMSARYEPPSGSPDPDDAARARTRANASLWSALDRGDDPTDEGSAQP
jgi:uncharacterized membrane protein (TIGR02234 family)